MLPARTEFQYPGTTMLQQLVPAEMLLVKLLRIWRLARTGRVPEAAWISALRAWDLPDTLNYHFDMLCHAVVTGNRRPLAVCGLGCCQIAEDEGRLLRVMAMLQHHRQAEAATALDAWLFPPAARRAESHMQALALGMSLAELVIPLMPMQLLTRGGWTPTHGQTLIRLAASPLRH